MTDNPDDQILPDPLDAFRDTDPPEEQGWAPTPSPPAPATDLLDHQLTMTVGVGYGFHMRSALQEGARKLYAEFAPTDVIESILARQAVVLNNVSMECFERYSMSTRSNWRQARLGLKASELTVSTIRVFEERKKKRQS